MVHHKHFPNTSSMLRTFQASYNPISHHSRGLGRSLLYDRILLHFPCGHLSRCAHLSDRGQTDSGGPPPPGPALPLPHNRRVAFESTCFSELQLWCVYYRSAPYLLTSHKKQVPIEYSLILSTTESPSPVGVAATTQKTVSRLPSLRGQGRGRMATRDPADFKISHHVC